MTALAANAARLAKYETMARKARFPVQTSATIYEGSLVSIIESSGRATPADNVAGEVFVGVSLEEKTGNTAGTVYVEVMYGHEVAIAAATALTKAYVGCNVAAMDDNLVSTLSAAGTAGVQVRVGELMELDGTTAWVWIRHYSAKAAP